MKAFDMLGNELNINDAIIFSDTDGMPGVSEIVKISDTRCYYPCKSKVLQEYGFRDHDQIVSLTALNHSRDEVHIIYKSSIENKDMVGQTLSVGSKVIGQLKNNFFIGTVTKFTAKMCCVDFNGTEVKKYTSHLLQIG